MQLCSRTLFALLACFCIGLDGFRHDTKYHLGKDIILDTSGLRDRSLNLSRADSQRVVHLDANSAASSLSPLQDRASKQDHEIVGSSFWAVQQRQPGGNYTVVKKSSLMGGKTILGKGLYAKVVLVTDSHGDEFAFKEYRTDQAFKDAVSRTAPLFEDTKICRHVLMPYDRNPMVTVEKRFKKNLKYAGKGFIFPLMQDNFQKYVETVGVGPDDVGIMKAFMKVMLSALLCVREKGMVHGDFKMDNILYKIEDRRLSLRLSDFDLLAKVKSKYITATYEINWMRDLGKLISADEKQRTNFEKQLTPLRLLEGKMVFGAEDFIALALEYTFWIDNTATAMEKLAWVQFAASRLDERFRGNAAFPKIREFPKLGHFNE